FYLNDGANENAEAIIAAARRLGIRVVLARCFYDWDGAPRAYREPVARAVANFQALARAHAADGPMVSVHAAPHSLHGASRDMIVAAAGCARDAGVPLHIHLAGALPGRGQPGAPRQAAAVRGRGDGGPRRARGRGARLLVRCRRAP